MKASFFVLLSLFILDKVLIKNKVYLLMVIICFSFGQTKFFFFILTFLIVLNYLKSVSVSIQ